MNGFFLEPATSKAFSSSATPLTLTQHEEKATTRLNFDGLLLHESADKPNGKLLFEMLEGGEKIR
jgi:hypothetical protein